MNITKIKIFRSRPRSKRCRKSSRKSLSSNIFWAATFVFLFALTLGWAKPIMAVVVDDVGGSLPLCRQLASISQPLNIAILPNTPYATKCAEIVSLSPHQLLIHFPWEALGYNYQKYYPIRITRGMSAAEMGKMLTLAFKKVPGAQGINNHMGSTLSASAEDMERFMKVLKKFRDTKYFLDSNTSRASKAYYWARKYGIKTAKNNVFLDGRQTPEYIERQFRYAVSLAKKDGSLVAICHGNRKVTMRVLPGLLKKYSAEVDFVYLPQLIEYRIAQEAEINYQKGI